jgi:hypothetical protein
VAEVIEHGDGDSTIMREINWPATARDSSQDHKTGK